MHAGALGWGSADTLGLSTPWSHAGSASGCYSAALVEVHFWLAIAGTPSRVRVWNSASFRA